jgi:hypothetical protein
VPTSADSQATADGTPDVRSSPPHSPPSDAGAGWTTAPQDGSRTKTANNTGDVKSKPPAAGQIRVPADAEKVIKPLKPIKPTDPPDQSPPTRPWTSRTPPARQALDELELELSLMVAGEMRAWRLADLRQRVDANLLRYESTAERVRARQLLERIAEFEQLQSRMAPATPAAPPAPSASAGVPAPPPAPAAPVAAAENAAGTAVAVKYDGSGWLVPVHSATGTAPPFALLDAQGEVLGYVSPTPGLNLQRYLRKQVGIFGQRGYVQSLNKPHVTAERIVDLDRHLR